MSLFSSNANIQPNEWNHIAFTYNKETSNVNLFVNNKIVISTKLEIELTKSLSDFNIGYSSNINDGEAYFNGTIDEILLYNRELNPKELEYVSKSNNTDLFLKNLVAGRWSFDEFTTQVNNLLDNSGNNNTAVASGNVTRGSTPAFGNHSIAFDGSSKISAPNTSLHTGYMSVGAWIKPTAYGETFIKKEGVFDVGVSSDGFPKMTIGDVSSELTSVLEKKKTEEQQNILDTLTHVEQFSLQNYVIDNVTIGNNGITVNDKMYTTSGLGSVQSDGTYNYLEMSSGKLIVPAYTYITSPTTINNTYYFVVKAQDINGSITRMTSATGDNFNIHVNWGSNTSVYPFNWPTNNNYIVSTTFAPKDSYIIIVLKILYKSANVYDARIQFIAKPDDGEYITVGYDQEILNMTSGSAINNDFDLGHGSLETSNFKLYEFGILDKYVTDIEFDEIVTYLKTKYYTPELLNQVVESSLVAHFALQNNTKDLTGLNSDAVGHNITYTTNSYNTYIGNTSVQLNGNDSYIDCGKVFQNVSDPNKMTLSMWVNMSELESDKKYPLMSSAGFEWYLNKPSNGTVDTYQNFSILDVITNYYSNQSAGNVQITTIDDSINIYSGITPDVASRYDANSTSIDLVSITGFAVGDLIMIMQVQGLDVYGQWELKRITNITGNTVTLNNPLMYTYTYVNETTAERYQVIKIPEYNTLTCESGSIITSKAWDGNTGGVLAISATTLIINGGTITMTGKGYRGGYNNRPGQSGWASENQPGSSGVVGEGYAGLFMSNWLSFAYNSSSGYYMFSRSANYGGGAGGGGGTLGRSWDGISAGSGGTHSHNFSTGDMRVKLTMGGGGGSGGQHDTSGLVDAGEGGGIIILIAENIEFNCGSIEVNGTNGITSTAGFHGGHAGGAGGSIVIMTTNSTGSATTLNVAGGVGGGSIENNRGGVGGSGSSGHVNFFNINSAVPTLSGANYSYTSDQWTLNEFIEDPEYNLSTEFDMNSQYYFSGTISIQVHSTMTDGQVISILTGTIGRGSSGKAVFSDPILLKVGAIYAYHDEKGYSHDQKGWVTLAEDRPYTGSYSTNEMYVYSNDVVYQGMHLQHSGTDFVVVNTTFSNYKSASGNNNGLKNGHVRLTVVERVVDETTSIYYGKTITDIKLEYYENSYYRTTEELLNNPGSLYLWQYASRLGTNLDKNIAKLQRPNTTISYFMQTSTHFDFSQSFAVRRLQ